MWIINNRSRGGRGIDGRRFSGVLMKKRKTTKMFFNLDSVILTSSSSSCRFTLTGWRGNLDNGYYVKILLKFNHKVNRPKE